MDTFENIVKEMPKFHQPRIWELYWQIIKNEYDNRNFSWYLLHKEEKYEYILKLRENYNKNYNEIKKSVEDITYNWTTKLDRFKCLKNKKLMDTEEIYDVPEDLFRCNNCGLIWDGMAQCYCSNDYILDFD